MMGGAGVAVISAGVFIVLSKKHKQNQSNYSIQPSKGLGNGVQVTTGNMGTTKQEPNWESPFNMNYLNDVQRWLAPRKIVVLNDVSAKKYARLLKNAKGVFDDDEDVVTDVFAKKLRDKTQVASLSKAFWQSYKKDLWQHLSSFLNPNEMQKYVHQYVKRMPNYQTR